MKAVNMTELKTNLSRYLRLAARWLRVVVRDRDEPIAPLAHPDSDAGDWRQRLAREGRLRPGSQNWSALKVPKPVHRVDIQSSLQATREECDERRRNYLR
jgi:antitoxin (DNA-binding transcriptional repressor) of toxin-antitoxin stability system